MPPTATLEDIKAYQDKVEKDKITPHHLPPCSRCRVDSRFFKILATLVFGVGSPSFGDRSASPICFSYLFCTV
jgi:hypothetical protein